MQNIYDLCCRYEGRDVRINCRDGRVHAGRITRVDRENVWILPQEKHGGCYGYGLFGGWGGNGNGYPVALGAIAGIILASAFFW